MTLAYIRHCYQVPAKRGGRILYTGDKDPRFGTVVAAADQYLRVRFDDQPKRIDTLHPTWEVVYLAGHLEVTFDRIGRTKNPPALQIPFADVALPAPDDFDALWPGDRTNWQVVVERIYDHARPMIRSRDLDVALTGDLTRIHGVITVGAFRNGGTFTITHPDQTGPTK